MCIAYVVYLKHADDCTPLLPVYNGYISLKLGSSFNSDQQTVTPLITIIEKDEKIKQKYNCVVPKRRDIFVEFKCVWLSYVK